MKKSAVLAALLCILTLFTACNEEQIGISVIEPETGAAGDRIYPAMNENAVEDSENVNGKRFTLTLAQFSNAYNTACSEMGFDELIDYEKWQKIGDTNADANGVVLQYYYYDGEDETNFTAAVETESNKIINIGLGTTMGNFVDQSDGISNSTQILLKAAVMAQAVCQFPTGSADVLQDIFYRTTMDSLNTLWYQGFIFTLSTQESSQNSENSIMLLRVFPISKELKEEWKVSDYEQYTASVPSTTTQS